MNSRTRSGRYHGTPDPVQFTESADLRLKTAAVYILSDWLQVPPSKVLDLLINGHAACTMANRTHELGYDSMLPVDRLSRDTEEITNNINARGRHDLRINVRRET